MKQSQKQFAKATRLERKAVARWSRNIVDLSVRRSCDIHTDDLVLTSDCVAGPESTSPDVEVPMASEPALDTSDVRAGSALRNRTGPQSNSWHSCNLEAREKTGTCCSCSELRLFGHITSECPEISMLSEL
jgi:hypothetical protein